MVIQVITTAICGKKNRQSDDCMGGMVQWSLLLGSLADPNVLENTGITMVIYGD